MDDLLETGTRCPHCRASVRSGAPWCSLCHADLRPPPAPRPVDIPRTASYAAPAPDPLTAPPAALGLPGPALPGPADAGTAEPATPGAAAPTWPCGTCGLPNPLTADSCVACGAGFLAALREAEGPLLELPGVGDLTRLTRGQRTMVAFGVVVAVLVLVALLGLLFS